MLFAVIIIGNFVFSTKERSSGKPPLSAVDMPSTSSTKIILFFPDRDFCSEAGLRIFSNFCLFLKSLAFNSKISEFVSFAKA